MVLDPLTLCCSRISGVGESQSPRAEVGGGSPLSTRPWLPATRPAHRVTCCLLPLFTLLHLVVNNINTQNSLKKGSFLDSSRSSDGSVGNTGGAAPPPGVSVLPHDQGATPGRGSCLQEEQPDACTAPSSSNAQKDSTRQARHRMSLAKSSRSTSCPNFKKAIKVI